MYIDLVISYVDFQNEEWQRSHREYATFPNAKFFRTGNNALRYLLRSVDKHLSFINQVFLLVQNRSEVPDYVNCDMVRIVTHNEFIPKKYLPTFNSTTIETFLAEIPDLSERFIYMNDDIFILNKLSINDFFIEDMAVTYFHKLMFEGTRPTFFESIVINDNELVLQQSRRQIWENGYAIRPNHTLRPYFKTLYKECYKKYWDKVESCLSRFRTPLNYNLYIVDLYQRSIGREQNLMTVRNVGIYNNVSDEELKILLAKDADTICILDHFPDVDIYENALLQEFFKEKFPTHSKYEK